MCSRRATGTSAPSMRKPARATRAAVQLRWTWLMPRFALQIGEVAPTRFLHAEHPGLVLTGLVAGEALDLSHDLEQTLREVDGLRDLRERAVVCEQPVDSLVE